MALKLVACFLAACCCLSAQTTEYSSPNGSSTSSTRVAATYYSYSSETITVSVTGTHQVSLYLLDWAPAIPASEIITLTNPSGAVLDTETFSTFQAGMYPAWNISGTVTFTVTRLSGDNAVVSALFFDPALLLSTVANSNYVGTVGGLGVEGVDIFGFPATVPSYASVMLAGGNYYTWANPTIDPRGLLTPSIGLGAVDGINKSFTLSSVPTKSAQVFYNGIRQCTCNDYAINGAAITFLTPPAAGSTILVDYQ